ncbi:MAG TPA: Fe-S cluster assembly protein SufD [Demequinaceae bacterium]
MSPAETLATDHSKAVADGSHTHGTGPGFAVPAKSRAERLTSFDPADFPMPTGREEDWRFTPLARLGSALNDVPVENSPTLTLDTLPPGVTVTQIDAAAARSRSVRKASDRAGAIAASRAPRGVLMSVARGAIVSRPVEIGGALKGGPFRTHFVLEVGEGAEVTVIARYTGAAEISEFLSIDLAARARLNLVLIDECSSEAIHLTDLVVRVGKDAHLRGSIVTLGAGLARTNATVEMAGEGSEVDLIGLYFADSGQHLENRVFIDHVAPRARSRVAYKGALAGQTARTIWIGDVLIRAAAEGTDTYELNRNLLLTEGARADSVPNLEIETGEIAGAGHASATGRFDDEQMFYLQSRGIPEDEARRMVVRGFFADLVRQIGVASVEQGLMRAIDRELGVAHE